MQEEKKKSKKKSRLIFWVGGQSVDGLKVLEAML